jgi:hypothetical protein
MSAVEINAAQVPFITGEAYDQLNIGHSLYLRLCGLENGNHSSISRPLKKAAFRSCALILQEQDFDVSQAGALMMENCPVKGEGCPILTKGIQIKHPQAEYSIARVGVDAAHEVWSPEQAQEYYYEHQLSPLLINGPVEIADLLKDPHKSIDRSFLHQQELDVLARIQPQLMGSQVQDPDAGFFLFNDLYIAGRFNEELRYIFGFENWKVTERFAGFYQAQGKTPMQRMARFLVKMNILADNIPQQNIGELNNRLILLRRQIGLSI